MNFAFTYDHHYGSNPAPVSINDDGISFNELGITGVIQDGVFLGQSLDAMSVFQQLDHQRQVVVSGTPIPTRTHLNINGQTYSFYLSGSNGIVVAIAKYNDDPFDDDFRRAINQLIAWEQQPLSSGSWDDEIRALIAWEQSCNGYY